MYILMNDVDVWNIKKISFIFCVIFHPCFLGVIISAATVLVWLIITFRTYHQVEDKEYARYAIGDVRQTIRNTHFESTTGSTPSVAR